MAKPKFSIGLLAAAMALVTVGGEIPEAEAGRRYQRAQPRARLVILPRGLYLGAGLVAEKILNQSGGPEYLDDGAGLTLYGGIRITRSLAIELGWIGTAHNPQTVDVGFGRETDYLVLHGFTADAKIFFGDAGFATDGQPRRLGVAQPYLQGGLGGYLLDSQVFGAQSIGTGFQLGGGVDWSIAPNLDIGLRGLYRGIAMGPPRESNQDNQDDTFISAISAEVSLGLRF